MADAEEEAEEEAEAEAVIGATIMAAPASAASARELFLMAGKLSAPTCR
ncbi:hypothetical protein GCM10017600_46920 [Streptosporangium carneum]|uniref:Uncharacterized protein n=1 Tax=Streptosporangium carneum TaxID=47481 RepID=A0A9W6I4J0_9ACTN|nr:hypothetical protein GCM10017600_46920 [Streptosporangium carneum]